MKLFRHAAFLALLLTCAVIGARFSYGRPTEDSHGEGTLPPEWTRFEKCPAYPTAKEIFLGDADYRLRALGDQTDRFAAKLAEPFSPQAMSHVNFIDDYVFGKMDTDGIPYTGLSSDSEFIRRVYIDTTGRVPSSNDVRNFLQNPDPNKRSALIDQLLAGDDFKDRVTLWLGDLVRNTPAILNPTGRTTYYQYLRDAVSRNVPFNQLVHDVITGKGDNYAVGPANYPVRELMGGPIQDTYDNLAVATAKQFLGVPMDCITCHNGAYHLEQINLYLSTKTRRQLWAMSAFFSGTRFQRTMITQNEFKYDVSDTRSNGYDARVPGGIRPPRTLLSGESPIVPPAYLFTGRSPSTTDFREELARAITTDDQFARNVVNRWWKELFGVGIVDPVDGFDMARQDPTQPPPAPWTVQPSNPQLLAALANDFKNNNYDLKRMISLMLKSSAYQLSARYNGVWDDRYAGYFARHLARRLSAEAIHDSITMATQQIGNYTIAGFASPVRWAVQLPDPTEPRSNGAVAQFLNVFNRGDRNTSERPAVATGSIFQALSLMNNAFVTQRVKVSSPNSLAARLRNSGMSADQMVDEMFLSTVSRYPTTAERSQAYSMLSASLNNGIEDILWVLINKEDFTFN